MKQKHGEIIKQGVECWNRWRAQSFEKKPNLKNEKLSHASLVGADLSGANLSGAILKCTSLNSANLSGANLSRANLRDANLKGVNLKNAHLHDANLADSELSDANLENVNLENSNLSRAKLIRSNLTHSTLAGANLSHANLSYAVLVDSDLTGANLREASLVGADLSGVNLKNADMCAAILNGVKLCLASLDGAILTWAKLGHADLERARLEDATLANAILQEANLRNGRLARANCMGVDLRNANLSEANLYHANLVNAELGSADFSGAFLFQTAFTNVNLGDVKGLDSCNHFGPSFLDYHTLSKSGRLPLQFLRGCGLSDEYIAYLPSLLGEPIQFYSCFISHSTKDLEFAVRLHADLQDKGVRCWFAPHDIQGGKKIHEQIDEAIRVYDRLVLILSKASMNSEWVKTEIAHAREKEMKQNSRVLFPIGLVAFSEIREWKCFDADTGTDSAREIREYYIPDFSIWQTDHDSYVTGFERLLRDLRAS